MGYNYDPEMLERHRATVDQLIELAKEGGRAKMEFEHPRELRTARHLINNILACLVFYRPEHEQIRLYLRTWTARENERWVLYIGKPSGVIAGPKAKVGSALLTGKERAKQGFGEDPREVRFDRPLRVLDDVVAFFSTVLELGAGVEVVRADHSLPGDFKPYFEENLAGWNVAVAPTTVVLTRKGLEPAKPSDPRKLLEDAYGDK